MTSKQFLDQIPNVDTRSRVMLIAFAVQHDELLEALKYMANHCVDFTLCAIADHAIDKCVRD